MFLFTTSLECVYALKDATILVVDDPLEPDIGVGKVFGARAPSCFGPDIDFVRNFLRFDPTTDRSPSFRPELRSIGSNNRASSLTFSNGLTLWIKPCFSASPKATKLANGSTSLMSPAPSRTSTDREASNLLRRAVSSRSSSASILFSTCHRLNKSVRRRLLVSTKVGSNLSFKSGAQLA